MRGSSLICFAVLIEHAFVPAAMFVVLFVHFLRNIFLNSRLTALLIILLARDAAAAVAIGEVRLLIEAAAAVDRILAALVGVCADVLKDLSAAFCPLINRVVNDVAVNDRNMDCTSAHS